MVRDLLQLPQAWSDISCNFAQYGKSVLRGTKFHTCYGKVKDLLQIFSAKPCWTYLPEIWNVLKQSVRRGDCIVDTSGVKAGLSMYK